MTETQTAAEIDLTNPAEIDTRIVFHPGDQVMEVLLTDVHFHNSVDVNHFYDRVEERIAETGEDLWFFLIDYSGTHIDPDSWVAFSRRGKALNLAHSMHTVRYDASDITRRQIERDAGTENFDPNLFADRDAAFARLAALPTKRVERIVHQPTFGREDLAHLLTFHEAEDIMEVDFRNLHFNHSADVDIVYDLIEEKIAATGRKWYFLVNYDGCRIMSEAWVQYAARGKRLNERWSLGSVRFAPGSETEADIRMRSESRGFRPNIRNTRDEALARIDEMKAEAASRA